MSSRYAVLDIPLVRLSKCIEKATVWFLGLLYGEQDDGAQRTTILPKLGEIIHLWVSDLLAVDYPAEEAEDIFSAFSKLVQAEDVPKLVNSSVVPISDVDKLIHAHWVRAARNMIDLPLLPAKPMETAIDALTVTLKLLDCIAAKDNRRSAAANTAPGHLIFSTLRVMISTDNQNQHPSDIRALCEQSISHSRRTGRSENEAKLFSSVVNHVLPLIRAAIKVELSSFNVPYSVHEVAPTSHVLHSLLCEVNEDKLNETAEEVLPILYDLVESVKESIRVQSFHSVSFLSSRLSFSVMAPARTSRSLQVED
ncbi:hypothetical protein FGB62_253g06 [Gracilaria domingensis]|nr:hypothetical protein FGB62_253g06 [Gracilaria domingensis]